MVVQDVSRRFRKTAAATQLPMFEAEIEGLAALRATNTVRVPQVVGSGQTGDGLAWLELEYMELQPLAHASGAHLGRQLAEMHRQTGMAQDAAYGWPRDNFIGPTPQSNQSHRSWAGFFAAERLRPQLEMAARNGMEHTLCDKGKLLAEKLGGFFLDYRPAPCLLHGDLWSGNAAQLSDGTPVIYDPAVHRGDREADVAMAELFGGFPESFYAAYRTAWPLDTGYETRKTLYNLYHVLNHYNLFGTSYLGQSRRMIVRLLAELRG